MVANRFVVGFLWAGLLGGSALAQVPPPPPPSALGTPPAGSPTTPPGAAPTTPGGLPPGGTMPLGPGGMPYPPPPAVPGPTDTLTAPPGVPVVGVGRPVAPNGLATGLPPGSVASPWVGGCPAGGCCGPLGNNGPISYELYARTGPTLPIGGGNVFTGALRTGWLVEGGGRSLFLNPPGDAAWVIDLNIGYSYNRGDPDRVFPSFAQQPRNAQTGALQGPDQLLPFRVRELVRTWFGYAVGRDWFLNGPGSVGGECNWNTRVGVDVGGRWGTSRVSLVPVSDPANYQRRSSIDHALVLGAHANWEMPMGAWVLFAGGRIEYVFNFTNVVPPQDGNIQDLNFLMTFGVRF